MHFKTVTTRAPCPKEVDELRPKVPLDPALGVLWAFRLVGDKQGNETLKL